jgi:hypothetical protein
VRYGSDYDSELAGALLGGSSGRGFTCLRCEWHEKTTYARLSSTFPVLVTPSVPCAVVPVESY